MCLYSRLIENPRYKPNKKNGGVIPAVHDTRVLYVPIICGNCIECLKKKAREWQVRLQEDIKTHKGAKFITLTFSNEAIQKTLHEIMYNKPDKWNMKGYELDNAIATKAMRMFNERYRKITGKALRHWTVTELGHNGTENIHLHGIIWPGRHKNNKKYNGRQVTLEDIEQIWGNGWIWKYKMIKGIKTNYVSNRTVNYCIKYVMKRDEKYKHYKSIILCSPGIGKNYTETLNARLNKFKVENTNQTYRTETGHKIALPTYWRKKIYNDEEREELWLQSMDKQISWVCGEKIKTNDNYKNLLDTIKHYRKLNTRLGYGSYKVDEERLKWEENRRTQMYSKRLS